jgi:hypothetical protein
MAGKTFDIYLPSNTAVEGNTTSSFRVKLPKTLNFNSASWSCAVVSIVYPHFFQNFGSYKLQFVDIEWQNGGITRLYLPSTSLATIQDLQNFLNQNISHGHLCKLAPTRAKRETVTDPEADKNARIDEGRKQADRLKDEFIAQGERDAEEKRKAHAQEVKDKVGEQKDATLNAGEKTAQQQKDATVNVGEKAAEQRKEQTLSVGENAADQRKEQVLRAGEQDAEKTRDALIEKGLQEAERKKEEFMRRGEAKATALKDQFIDGGRQQADQLLDTYQNLTPNERKRKWEELLLPGKSKTPFRQQFTVPDFEPDDSSQFPTSNIQFSETEIQFDQVQCENVRAQSPFNRLPDYFKIEYDPRAMKFKIQLDAQHLVSATFSEQLAFILGLENQRVIQTKTVEFGCDLRGGQESLYFYAPGLVENSIIGDRMAPLLRIVTLKGHQGNIIEDVYLNPEYKKLASRSISEITIEVRSNTGRLVKFIGSDIIICLNFRKQLF